ncbi:MAG: hypothetical protein H0X33_08670 [Taibaiella sp.]|nr:hypothetical protein [Taibaiella sp.]
MYIKDQTFKDEETLMEMLFDFSLGESSALLKEMIAAIDEQLRANHAYVTYRDSLEDEDDRSELYIEERDMLLAEKLLEQYDSFAVIKQKLYAVKGDRKDMLYEIDLI